MLSRESVAEISKNQIGELFAEPQHAALAKHLLLDACEVAEEAPPAGPVIHEILPGKS